MHRRSRRCERGGRFCRQEHLRKRPVRSVHSAIYTSSAGLHTKLLFGMRVACRQARISNCCPLSLLLLDYQIGSASATAIPGGRQRAGTWSPAPPRRTQTPAAGRPRCALTPPRACHRAETAPARALQAGWLPLQACRPGLQAVTTRVADTINMYGCLMVYSSGTRSCHCVRRRRHERPDSRLCWLAAEAC